jgi:Oxidoreductase molybdopterin binding domain.
MRSTGDIEGPFEYKGTRLVDLCNLVGGITPSTVVRATAKDGYSMTFSYKQLTEGDFITYNPATKEEVSHGELVVILVYEEGGKPLSEMYGAPLRLGIVDSKNQVTDGHWWVKWIEKIEIESAPKDWTLHLEGAVSEDIDRATFESGAASKCHGAKWVDDEGRKWKGIPLWLFVGKVDDDVKHGSGAFNDGLADKGYEVKVTASDGYSHTFSSADVKRNEGIIVAYKMNGAPLPEEYWPLSIVGPGLTGKQKVGQIVKIEIVFP